MKKEVIKIMLGWVESNELIETTADKLLNLFNVSGSLPSDEEIRKYASNYSQNWSENKIQKSIAYTAYHRGCKRIIRLFNSKFIINN